MNRRRSAITATCTFILSGTALAEGLPRCYRKGESAVPVTQPIPTALPSIRLSILALWVADQRTDRHERPR